MIKQDLNKAVFTLKSIINKAGTILYVVHDNEGEWQFLNGEPVSLQDMMIVSLQQIIDIDNTVLQILDLKMGHTANRKNTISKWEITESGK
ncbi:hypothetical protein KXD93_19890 [Mucilaginibacter sp. BJC16-A38]|uniref:hypothetical protein n=1 Tax=Mucilaginibacter phenanthrenivorans TaxID=1234842 RepID=UPI0021576B42|nr:hypothetical protein [Mucilaginibacter phenanthrenivorans]MCR8559923.1 hypothetical protein [Mucilaginibacter phenanthrenivorans]